jgi:septum site-determining protein MinC
MKESAVPPVQIKANRGGFVLVPDPVLPLETVLAYMTQRLTESHHFLKCSKMTLDLRQRPFRAEEVQVLQQLLKEKGDIDLVEVWLGNDLTSLLQWGSRQLGVGLTLETTTEQQPAPVIVRMTCRSGTRIESEADCIILGDVNPGAEVVAAGDIIVFGRLRGVAHAGARGDRAARIWAMSIEPNQLRIADQVAVPPRDGERKTGRFEMAEIQGEVIQVTTMH